ncbi:hypothetical protein [Acidithiobacillus sulfuriphilus]|uniref:Uncharacterized protein n=2 Tax=Acidithiobacillus sulfuriphilus TaxID=1867749 RepID=A0A3M8R9X5_9PROT|nr:hypothetical protein [Acidithiobacillus sulfuriphilus]RNF63240.1 hypothetical protein EC580_06815 [Acidithiobacillus sulfuriphilus]
MNISGNDFRAWYYSGAQGESKIGVVGKIVEIDGGITTLVRADPQGINRRVLMLTIQTEPFKGKYRPHIAHEKELRYDEVSERGTFSDVHIESKDVSFTLKIEATK